MSPIPVREGYMPFSWPPAGKPLQTWYQVHGDLKTSKKNPLICLHGGPGAAHEYTRPLADLASKFDIPVILYDQVGCGKSTRLDEFNGKKEFWEVQMFVDELEALVDQLGVRDRGFDIWGQSWGAMLGGDYARRRP
jgi:proline-specific peptidase